VAKAPRSRRDIYIGRAIGLGPAILSIFIIPSWRHPRSRPLADRMRRRTGRKSRERPGRNAYEEIGEGPRPRSETAGEGGEAPLTAKDPNRRVNTLLILRREAQEPNGIRFGDLVGGLRRPPAATTTFTPLLTLAATSILTSHSRRRCQKRYRGAGGYRAPA
jgi:hypothetical protein